MRRDPSPNLKTTHPKAAFPTLFPTIPKYPQSDVFVACFLGPRKRKSAPQAIRGVAQLGRALRLGRRCRRFESCLPDHFKTAVQQRFLCFKSSLPHWRGGLYCRLPNPVLSQRKNRVSTPAKSDSPPQKPPVRPLCSLRDLCDSALKKSNLVPTIPSTPASIKAAPINKATAGLLRIRRLSKHSDSALADERN